MSKRTKKRYKTYKPYWNEELENLWRIMHKCEKDYTRFRGRRENRDSLRIKFLISRNKFDKVLRTAERSFNKFLCMEIEDNCTNNPRAFWSHIQKPGPNRNTRIPFEVYDNDNNLNSNEDVVFKKWSEDFQTLYDNSSINNEFNEQFYENIIREKDFLEGHMLDPLYEENLFLNRIISLEEVESVVKAAKSGKSVGIDKIPYEVLKFPVVISLLHSLFNLCLDTGIVPTAWKKAIISPIPKDTT